MNQNDRKYDILNITEKRGGGRMSRRESIFLAKKLFTELVFNTAYIEGVNVTFPQTQTIIDGGVVSNVPVSDIQTVLNLRDGWKYALDTLDEPLTLDYICHVNGLVSRNESLEWGKLRTGTVNISGTDYIPPVPQEDEVRQRIEEIAQITDTTEQAIEYFCYAVRAQLFWDGNKRTSTIAASKILVQEGVGVLTIDTKHAERFNEALTDYYNTTDKAALAGVLRDCIKTMEPVKEPPPKDKADLER